MLRRNQASAADGDTVGSMRAEIERAFGPSETPSLLRRGTPLRVDDVLDAPEEEPRPAPKLDVLPRSDVDPVDAPKLDRRRLEALKAEIQRAMVTSEYGEAEPPPFKWKLPISPAQLALVMVALVAGGLAAFLATRDFQPAPVEPVAPTVVTQVMAEAKARILVAREPIGIGQRLTPKSVEWVDWPEGALRPEFVTIANSPEAPADMNGAIARFEFFPGEPIRAEKLAQPGLGFLSAVLESGMRGVSVGVSAESASGGFIVPGDRVDVVLTRENNSTRISDTILRNVRVLAIDTRLGVIGKTAAAKDAKDSEEEDEDNPKAKTFSGGAVATLELDPDQSEVIVNATEMGKLTLVLRPIVDTAEAGKLEERTTNQAIRISSPFWQN